MANSMCVLGHVREHQEMNLSCLSLEVGKNDDIDRVICIFALAEMLNTFSRLWMIIKMCETPLSWHTECSVPVAVRVSKPRVLKLPNNKGIT